MMTKGTMSLTIALIPPVIKPMISLLGCSSVELEANKNGGLAISRTSMILEIALRPRAISNLSLRKRMTRILVAKEPYYR